MEENGNHNSPICTECQTQFAIFLAMPWKRNGRDVSRDSLNTRLKCLQTESKRKPCGVFLDLALLDCCHHTQPFLVTFGVHHRFECCEKWFEKQQCGLIGMHEERPVYKHTWGFFQHYRTGHTKKVEWGTIVWKEVWSWKCAIKIHYRKFLYCTWHDWRNF